MVAREDRSRGRPDLKYSYLDSLESSIRPAGRFRADAGRRRFPNIRANPTASEKLGGRDREAESETLPAVFSTNWRELTSDWSVAPKRSAKSAS